ncbi:hypothetical protein SPONL_1842 [uncultured Candidatus Thioglobus sp.]|nr:hypothetical protein SPONL_1842 [uncultured Candidatus Thioglobus sp.]
MPNNLTIDNVQSLILQIRDTAVIIDSDVAQLYGVETKNINRAVKNNEDKFPDGYVFSLSNNEKSEVVENFHHLENLKFSSNTPNAFTEKGLYMLATILKSEKATQTTLKIIDTFANIKQLSHNLNSFGEHKSVEKQQKIMGDSNKLLEKIIDIQPTTFFKDDKITEVETRIELSIGFAKISRIIKKKK